MVWPIFSAATEWLKGQQHLHTSSASTLLYFYTRSAFMTSQIIMAIHHQHQYWNIYPTITSLILYLAQSWKARTDDNRQQLMYNWYKHKIASTLLHFLILKFHDRSQLPEMTRKVVTEYFQKLRNLLLLQHNSQVPLHGIVHYVDIIGSTTFKLV